MWKINSNLEQMLNKMEKELCTDCINSNLCLNDETFCFEYWAEVKEVMKEFRKNKNS